MMIETLLKICSICFIIIIQSCTNYEKAVQKGIVSFEDDYKETLDDMTDELVNIKELDTNYVFGVRPKYNYEVYFYYLTEDDTRGSYFDVSYELSKKQIRFFRETTTDKIEYSKKYNCFYLKPFYFKDGNRCLLIEIAMDNRKRNDLELKKIYESGNYSYYLTEAW